MTTLDAEGRPHAFAGQLVSARRRARQRLLAHLMTAREDERRRIARDLAEHPLRSVTALRARLEELEPRAGRPGLDGELDSLRRDVEEICRTLQRLAADLVFLPEIESLESALRRFLDRAECETGVRCTLHADLPPDLEPTVAAAALRIVQEAVTNACRHTDAATVQVSATGRDGLVLRVQDDGAGFDPAAARTRPGRTGLALMRQHAELVGGHLEVRSAAGSGTVVELRVPGSPLPAPGPWVRLR